MSKNIVLSISLMIVLVYLLIEYITAPRILTSSYLLRILLVALGSSLLFFFKNENKPSLMGQYFKISTFFLVGFLIVHYQIYIDFVLGNYYKFGHDYLINPAVVPQSIVLSTIALVSFYIGYLFFLNRNTKTTLTTDRKNLLNVKGIQFLAVCLLALFLLNANWRYFQGQYGREGVGQLADYFQSYFVLTICGSVIVNCWNLVVANERQLSFFAYLKRHGKLVYGLLLIYIPLVIMSGDRGPILQILMMFFGGYIIVTNKKLRVLQIIGLGVLAIGAISIMGLARTLTDGKSYIEKLQGVEDVRLTYSGSNSFSPNTMELGTVVRTLHAAVDYTDKSGFTYGMFQSFQVMGVIPGMGVLFLTITGLDNSHVSSALFLSQQILGKDAHGLGTTCVADVFLDFGVFGVLVFFLGFGFFVRNLEEKSFDKNLPSLFVWVMLFIFLSKSIYIGRSTIMILFRESVLTILLIGIGLKISSLFFKSHRPKSKIIV